MCFLIEPSQTESCSFSWKITRTHYHFGTLLNVPYSSRWHRSGLSAFIYTSKCVIFWLNFWFPFGMVSKFLACFSHSLPRSLFDFNDRLGKCSAFPPYIPSTLALPSRHSRIMSVYSAQHTWYTLSMYWAHMLGAELKRTRIQTIQSFALYWTHTLSIAILNVFFVDFVGWLCQLFCLQQKG